MNYQIMTNTVEMRHGRGYVPDWQVLLDGTESKGERKMLYAKMKNYKDRPIAFSFKLIYVSRMRCGHYEIFQSPLPETQLMNRILQIAKAYAYDHKCTRCACKWDEHQKKREKYGKTGQ